MRVEPLTLEPRRGTGASTLRLAGWLWQALMVFELPRRLRSQLQSTLHETNSDALHLYLPAARGVLEQGWRYLVTDEQAYHTAPLGYLWPAVWGADELSIRIANCVLLLLCVPLLWRATTRLGGMWAGVVATLLLVTQPSIPYFAPKVLTEPLFLFGFFLGLYGAVELLSGRKAAKTYVAVTSLGLTITLLSRPVLQAVVVVATLTLAAIWCWQARRSPRLQRSARPPWGPLAAAFAMALCLPAAVAVKNGLAFGVWGLSTGAGAGLYYGVNPLRQGLEPFYTGFEYDISAVVATADLSTRGNPMSKRSDEIARNVALSVLRNTTWTDNLQFMQRKAAAWAFYSVADVRIDPKIRIHRLIEWGLILAALGSLAFTGIRQGAQGLLRRFAAGDRCADPARVRALALRRAWTCLALLGGFGAVLVQLLPILYNSRYNSALMDPWLMPVAGVGAAIVLGPLGLRRVSCDGRNRYSWGASIASLMLTGLVVWLAIWVTEWSKWHETLSPNAARPGPTAPLLRPSAFAYPRAVSMETVDAGWWTIRAEEASLLIPFHVDKAEALWHESVLDAVWIVRLGVAGNNTRSCRRVTVAVNPAHSQGQFAEPVLHVRTDGLVRDHAVFGNHSLRPAGSGELRLTFDCLPGTTVRWEGAQLLRSTMHEATRALIRDGTPIDPYRRSEP